MSNNKKRLISRNIIADNTRRNEVHDRMQYAISADIMDLVSHFDTGFEGLSEEQVETNQEHYGRNEVARSTKASFFHRFMEAFVNPFTAILIVLAIVSTFTDIVWAGPGERNPMAVIIITTMVIVSGLMRFIQETRSGNAAENLLKMIHTTTSIKRQGQEATELPLEEVVVGDVIYLAAGDMIPADMRLFQAKDLFVGQASLTGESLAVEKTIAPIVHSLDALTEASNLAFMGTNVISGSARGIVIAVGEDTIFGDMARGVNVKPVKTSFEKGVNNVSWLLIRFMLIMVPVVLFTNGVIGGNWMDAALFALAVAVGLTPEMLPMIVTTCLAKGAVAMSQQKTIIKNLNSIQNLGSMDILCTDKTGTLTQDKVVLQYHLDVQGNESPRVLRHGFLNSYYQTGLKNLMDIAIIDAGQLEASNPGYEELLGLSDRFVKVDEIPFDFDRRRMSVVVESNDATKKTQVITKGAVEEMLSICSHVEYDGSVIPLTDEISEQVLKRVEDFNDDGLRVIALAQKTNPPEVGTFSIQDESEMVLMGYLAFLDPPKESTEGAIRALNQHGVEVKILTGDNDKVTRCICRQVGLPVERILLGNEIEEMSDLELSEIARGVSVFAKLSPSQKARVIGVLRDLGHSVGYMGDGINDAAAMKASDVGISVDTAVDIAKESADVILLEKDLMVLENGILEGRKTYANMIKYIKMTASSNFGNIFSVMVASIFLPFMPMLPIHLILLNLIYDLSCTAIPWDNVDAEYLKVPRKWDASSIGKFMLWFGPTSSIFDISTFALLYFLIAPMVVGGGLYHQLTDPSLQLLFVAVFHAGWFVESMWTQTMVIHMIRTPKIPFIQSRASTPLLFLSLTGIVVLTTIPFTRFGASLGLTGLPPVFFAWLVVTVILYMFLVQFFKRIFIRRYGELL